MVNVIKISKKGFTLLEMLVVIGIIGVLVGMGAVSYSSAQKKSRDSKRKSDLKVIQSSLEQYYSVCKDSPFTYPNKTTAQLYSGGITCTDPSMTILSSSNLPKDPKSLANYTYTYVSASNTYTICTSNMETETPATLCLDNQQ